MKRLMRIISRSIPARLDVFEYGRIGNGLRARRNRFTGEVQFLLWKAGEQGHDSDFYQCVGAGWEQSFRVDAKP